MILKPAYAGAAPDRRVRRIPVDVDQPRLPPGSVVLPPSWLRNAIVIVVLVMWVAGFVVSILNPNFDVPAPVHTAALMIIGAVFGVSFKRSGA